MVWVLATEGDRLFQCGIVRGGGGGWGVGVGGNSSRHHSMSGIYNIEYYVLLFEHKSCLARMETYYILCCVTSQGNNQINLTYCDETKIMALNTSTGRAKEK